MEIQQGEALGVGVTVDADGDVVLVITIVIDEDNALAVSMMPDMARHFGRTVRDISRDADKLQDELEDLDPEEIEDRLHAIRNRYAVTAPAPPDETV